MTTSTIVRIVETPEILQANPRIEGTRTGAFQIDELVRRRDWPPADVTDELYLEAADAEAAVEYYDEHPELMETLRDQHEAGLRSIDERSRHRE